jgi:hypothetical protein
MLVTAVSWLDAPRWDLVFLAAIACRQAATPTSQLGVASGWSSDKTFFAEPALAPLEAWIRTVLAARCGVTACDLSGWANVMRPGDVVREHHHEKSHLGGLNRYAGTYFPGASPDAAPLILYDDLPNRMLTHAFTPTRGLLVLFDADTPHHVPMHRGRAPRVSLAFNVRVWAGPSTGCHHCNEPTPTGRCWWCGGPTRVS